MPKVSGLVALYPNDCGSLQSLRAECAHHTYFMNSGYINYYINDNFKPFEHRLMAELVFGKIPADYQVHHINRVRSDNRACNLEIISAREHALRHHPRVITAQMQPCAYCGEPVVAEGSRLYRNENFYCNRICYRLGSRNAERPSAEELQQLLVQIGNWSAIGRMYSVSDNAVRKWARAYGIDPKAHNGRVGASSPYGS